MARRIPRLLIVLLALMLIAAAVIYFFVLPKESEFQRFTCRASDIFDTEISLTGFAKSEEEFTRVSQEAMTRLSDYNAVFDGYNAYGDLHNLWYINRYAKDGPVEVPDTLFSLLAWCKEQWEAGNRTVNIAMGAVLSIWHDYRTAGLANPETASLPPMEQLQEAAKHTHFEDVILDPAKHTVFYSDPLLQIDLGAVAKGYAADLARDYLKEAMPSFLLSLGGNVYAGAAPKDGRSAWAVAVQDPRASVESLLSGGSDRLDILDIASLTAVTSGDYWRYYTVDGKRYHHIIDPDTLMPSTQMLSVTVVCESSLMGDYLSTTLFILPYEEGLKLVSGMPGVEVLWVLPDGDIQMTPGMAAYARSQQQ